MFRAKGTYRSDNVFLLSNNTRPQDTSISEVSHISETYVPIASYSGLKLKIESVNRDQRRRFQPVQEVKERLKERLQVLFAARRLHQQVLVLPRRALAAHGERRLQRGDRKFALATTCSSPTSSTPTATTEMSRVNSSNGLL